jgi:hypothetical protein
MSEFVPETVVVDTQENDKSNVSTDLWHISGPQELGLICE